MSENLTHWKKLTNPDYLGTWDLQEGEEKVIKILSVSQEIVKGADGKGAECIVAKVKDNKPLILNKTNCKILTKLFKSPHIQHWVGRDVIIYTEHNVKAFGDLVDALRIKPTVPQLPELKPDSPKWEGARKAIQDGTVTIAAIKKTYSLTPANEKLLTAKD